MTREEHETHIRWDYAGRAVHFYTTRRGQKNQLMKRIGQHPDVELEERTLDGETIAWDITAPIDIFGAPAYASNAAGVVAKKLD